MKIHELTPAKGSKHRRKIIGRGEGSGHGGSATRGTKGQGARSGQSIMVGFEGGQMPLIRRIPKRGFNHTRFHTCYGVVNLRDIDVSFQKDQKITPGDLVEKGLVKKHMLVKILGDGEITKPLNITAHKFSKSAEEKIKKAGGTIERAGTTPHRTLSAGEK